MKTKTIDQAYIPEPGDLLFSDAQGWYSYVTDVTDHGLVYFLHSQSKGVDSERIDDGKWSGHRPLPSAIVYSLKDFRALFRESRTLAYDLKFSYAYPEAFLLEEDRRKASEWTSVASKDALEKRCIYAEAWAGKLAPKGLQVVSTNPQLSLF